MSECSQDDMYEIGLALKEKEDRFVKLGLCREHAEKLSLDIFVNQLLEKIEKPKYS